MSRLAVIILALILAQAGRVASQGASVYFTPPVQTAAPGETFTFTLTGPPGAPFSILTDTVPALTTTPYGTLGLALSPTLGAPLDGLALSTLLGIPGTPTSVAIPPSGFFTGSTAQLSASLVGTDLYLQAVVYDASSPSVLVLSANGAILGNSASCRASVVSGLDLTLDSFDVVDINYVDPLYTSLTGVTRDIVPSVTFHDVDVPGGRVAVRNDTSISRNVRIRYDLHGGPGTTAPILETVTTASYSVGSGNTRVDLHEVPAFPNIQSHTPGAYTLAARLFVEASPGSSQYDPVGVEYIRPITVTDRRPVILVHGIIEDGTRFLDLANLLETLGPDPIPVRRFNYGSADGSIPGMTGKVLEFENFLNQAGYTEFDAVAHSIGGLILRKFLIDHPPNGWMPRIVFFGTPHFGPSLIFIDAGVLIMDLAYAGSMVGSQFIDDITPASTFLKDINDNWPTVGATTRILNIMGTNCGGDGDGIVRVNESFLPNLPGTPPQVLNRYVSEIHGTIPAFISIFNLLTPCSLPSLGLGAIDAASAPTRSSWLMLRDFLTATDPMTITTPAGASNTPPSGVNRGDLWIPLNGSAPLGDLFYGANPGTPWFNYETSTFVWLDAPANGTGTLCFNLLPLTCLFASTCNLPSGVAQVGRCRRANTISFSGGCTISANTTVFPY